MFVDSSVIYFYIGLPHKQLIHVNSRIVKTFGFTLISGYLVLDFYYYYCPYYYYSEFYITHE